MKIIKLISLLLCLLMCFAACNKADEPENEGETKVDETKADETEEDKVDASVDGKYTVFSHNSVKKDGATLTLEKDNTFTHVDSYSFDLDGYTIIGNFVYTGTYSVDNGIVTCTAGKAKVKFECDDESAFLAYLEAANAPDYIYNSYAECMLNDEYIVTDDYGEESYEKTIFVYTLTDGKLVMSNVEEWYADCENAHMIYVFKDGNIVTKTLYTRTGSVTYINRYENNVLRSCENYSESTGELYSTVYYDENGEYVETVKEG